MIRDKKIEEEINSFLKLANLSLQQGEINKALYYYEEILKIEPNNTEIHQKIKRLQRLDFDIKEKPLSSASFKKFVILVLPFILVCSLLGIYKKEIVIFISIIEGIILGIFLGVTRLIEPFEKELSSKKLVKNFLASPGHSETIPLFMLLLIVALFFHTIYHYLFL